MRISLGIYRQSSVISAPPIFSALSSVAYASPVEMSAKQMPAFQRLRLRRAQMEQR